MEKLDFLVIDDEPDVRSLLEDILKIGGHSVTTAGSGNEGIALYKKRRTEGGNYNGIFTDLNMPNGTGIDVIRTIRGQEDTETPIYVVTGGIDTDEYPILEELAKEDPKIRIMHKPFGIVDLVAQIESDFPQYQS